MKRLPTSTPGTADEPTVQSRNEGVRRVRRVSNWTAAALVVGTGATAVALAHNAVPYSGASSSSTTTGTGTSFTGTAGTGTTPSTKGGPQVSHTVATTSASGVTTLTTTRVVNGHTVVTHTKNAPAYHDD